MKKLSSKNCNLNELKAFCDVNFIITDIDGTLIKRDETVFQQVQVINNKKKSEFRFKWGRVLMTIATGRTYFGARKVMEDLNIQRGIPIVLYNGAVIIAYQTNELLFQKTIPEYFIRRLEAALNLKKEYFLMYTMEIKRETFQSVEEIVVEKVYGIGKQCINADVNGLEIVWNDVLEDNLIEPCSILINRSILSMESKEKVHQVLETAKEIAYTDSGNGFIEISGSNVNKGIVFDVLREKRPFLIKKSLAIGDNDNDCELLKAADIGVAVANGSRCAKEVADYICEHEGAAGVLDVMNTLKNANKYWGNRQ